MITWTRKILLVTAMSAALLLPAREADAALNAYLVLKGQKTGEIEGSVKQKGHEGAIEVISYNHTIVSPRDSASGQATGKRQHKPIILTLELDVDLLRILIGMLEAGEKLDGSLSVATKKKGKGTKAEYLEIKMTDVLISSYNVSTTVDGRDLLVLEVMPAMLETKLADGTTLHTSVAATAPIKKQPVAK
jgi:type VI secretion system secreted protein Hcp